MLSDSLNMDKEGTANRNNLMVVPFYNMNFVLCNAFILADKTYPKCFATMFYSSDTSQ